MQVNVLTIRKRRIRWFWASCDPFYVLSLDHFLTFLFFFIIIFYSCAWNINWSAIVFAQRKIGDKIVQGFRFTTIQLDRFCCGDRSTVFGPSTSRSLPWFVVSKRTIWEKHENSVMCVCQWNFQYFFGVIKRWKIYIVRTKQIISALKFTSLWSNFNGNGLIKYTSTDHH